MKKISTLIFFICAVFQTSVISKVVTFSTPVPWSSLRTHTVPVQFSVDSSLLGKRLDLEIHFADGVTRKRVAKTEILAEALTNETRVSVPEQSYSLINRGHFLISWRVVGDTLSGYVAPFSIAPISGGDLSDLSPDKVEGLFPAVSNSSFRDLAGNSVAFQNTTKDIKITVRKSDKPLTIAFDPANSKDGFLIFSNRFIRISEGEVSLIYYRKSYSDDELKYKERVWYGTQTIEKSGDFISITIPWYDLGIHYASNRRFGIALFSDSSSYPSDALEFSPNTWGDMIVK